MMQSGYFISTIITSYNLDIIITETWLTPDVDSTTVNRSRLHLVWLFRKDRPRDWQRWRCYHRHQAGLWVKHRPDLDTDCEIIWVQLQTFCCKSLLLGAFYRPPSTIRDYLITSQARFLAYMQTHLDHGWFYLPHIDWTAISPYDSLIADTPNPIIPHTNRRQLHDIFMDTINTFSLSQTVLQPTRTQTTTRPAGHSDSTDPLIVSFHIHLTFSSHTTHLTNTQVVPLLTPTLSQKDKDRDPNKLIYLYTRTDLDSIRQDMKAYSTDFFTAPLSRSPSSIWNSFKHAIHTTMSINIPQKTLK